MTQYDLDTAVARATGETLAEIRHRGFSVADPLDVDFDPEPDNAAPQVLDWDQWDADSLGPLPTRLDQLVRGRVA
jgi:hypothetical protein